MQGLHGLALARQEKAAVPCAAVLARGVALYLTLASTKYDLWSVVAG